MIALHHNSLPPFNHGLILIGEYYLWQIDIWHNDTVQGTRGVFRWVPGITEGVISVLEVVLGRIALSALGLPWHTAGRNADFLFGSSGCWLAPCEEGSIEFIKSRVGWVEDTEVESC